MLSVLATRKLVGLQAKILSYPSPLVEHSFLAVEKVKLATASVSVLLRLWIKSDRTSAASPRLCLLVLNSFCRSSRCRLSSANFAFFASISSLRDCSDDMIALTIDQLLSLLDLGMSWTTVFLRA